MARGKMGKIPHSNTGKYHFSRYIFILLLNHITLEYGIPKKVEGRKTNFLFSE